jgi:hypothetical protein
MQIWMRVSFVLLGVVLAGTLQAQSCGTVLSASVTLTRDMDCRGYPYAFRVIRDGVVVNLNGRSIRGDGAGDGIVATGVRNLVVRGPGRLQQLQRAIGVERVESLLVSGIDIHNSTYGVELLASRAAKIEHDRFDGNFTSIEIRQPAGFATPGAGAHVVHSNQFGSADFTNLRLCGADAGDNVVTGNSFAMTEHFSLEVSHESARNRIEHNKFRTGAWLGMRSTNANVVRGNVFEAGARGVLLSPLPPSDDCLTRDGTAKAGGNQFLDNRFFGAPYPFVLGHSDRPGSFVTDNRIGDNRIERAEIGITLHRNTYGNDARGNVYVAVARPVSDGGVGNLHP